MLTRQILHQVRTTIASDDFWDEYLRVLDEVSSPAPGLHLGVFIEPFLNYVLGGQKTVESRFSSRRTPPYGTIGQGDVILLKRSGGPIVGICVASEVWFYKLVPSSWKRIRAEFSLALCAQDPSFWQARKAASYATLIRLNNVRSIAPIEIEKRDRRGWVTISQGLSPNDE